MPANPIHDFHTYTDGSMVGVDAKSEEARAWLEENVESNGYQWLGQVLWIDARYALGLIHGAENDGFSFAYQGSV